MSLDLLYHVFYTNGIAPYEIESGLYVIQPDDYNQIQGLIQAGIIEPMHYSIRIHKFYRVGYIVRFTDYGKTQLTLLPILMSNEEKRAKDFFNIHLDFSTIGMESREIGFYEVDSAIMPVESYRNSGWIIMLEIISRKHGYNVRFNCETNSYRLIPAGK